MRYFGNYYIEKYHNSGGMSDIYTARRRSDGSRAAVKTCSHDNKSGQKALYNEYRILSSLKNDGIPAVYEYGATPCEDYLVMQYIDGNSLEERLKSNMLSADECIGIIIELCRILMYLHNLREPVFHCDIKPGNIILTGSGRVVLIDYGTAVQGQYDGVHFGTVSYAAPEQFGGQSAIDARTDIYSVGILLKNMVRGQNDRFGYRLSNVITRCTYEDKQLRFCDVSDIVSELMFISGRKGLVKSVFVPCNTLYHTAKII